MMRGNSGIAATCRGAVTPIAALAFTLAGVTLGALPASATNWVKPPKDTCSLARNRDVAKVVGNVIDDPTQTGPTTDPDNPSVTSTRCEFQADAGQVTIIVASFPSPSGAATALHEAVDNLQTPYGDDAGQAPTVTPESGLGSSSYWVMSTIETDSVGDRPGTIVQKGTYLVLAGQNMITVGTDWSDAPPDTLKPALFDLTQSVISRASR